MNLKIKYLLTIELSDDSIIGYMADKQKNMRALSCCWASKMFYNSMNDHISYWNITKLMIILNLKAWFGIIQIKYIWKI